MFLPTLPQESDLPVFPREFRAVWVATVDNIDWPSKRTLSPDLQRAELTRILDLAKGMRLNAVILQVRPAADALYMSSLEPWSEYLTGRQGKAPNPAWDPLEFAVTEAHRRGLELHCWLNPYRARHLSAKAPLAKNHIAHTYPSVVKSYGGQLWMDPGEPRVQKRTLDVVADVVKRYDIDGVHMDDYFYPYPVKGSAFPDAESYARYGKGLSLDDWRRQNVDNFIEQAYSQTKQLKPWVKFGISPFGIYRPGVPEGITSGVDQYATLYADPLKWLQKGWVDYLAPQLYWPINQRAQSFPILLNWWITQNPLGRPIWPGLFTSRTLPGQKPKFSAEEVVNQVLMARTTPGAGGHIHFSVKALTTNASGVADALRGSCYAEDALPPEMPWLVGTPPASPLLTRRENVFEWTMEGEPPAHYAMWTLYGSKWLMRSLPGTETKLELEPQLAIGKLSEVAISAVSRCGQMSKPTRSPGGCTLPGSARSAPPCGSLQS